MTHLNCGNCHHAALGHYLAACIIVGCECTKYVPEEPPVETIGGGMTAGIHSDVKRTFTIVAGFVMFGFAVRFAFLILDNAAAIEALQSEVCR